MDPHTHPFQYPLQGPYGQPAVDPAPIHLAQPANLHMAPPPAGYQPWNHQAPQQAAMNQRPLPQLGPGNPGVQGLAATNPLPQVAGNLGVQRPAAGNPPSRRRQQGARRNRTPTKCIRCQQKKVKCDKGPLPGGCTTCRRKGVRCEYGPANRICVAANQEAQPAQAEPARANNAGAAANHVPVPAPLQRQAPANNAGPRPEQPLIPPAAADDIVRPDEYLFFVNNPVVRRLMAGQELQDYLRQLWALPVFWIRTVLDSLRTVLGAQFIDTGVIWFALQNAQAWVADPAGMQQAAAE
jgi:hypothetical protein